MNSRIRSTTLTTKMPSKGRKLISREEVVSSKTIIFKEVVEWNKVQWSRPCSPSSRTYSLKITKMRLHTEIIGSQLRLKLPVDRVLCREMIRVLMDGAHKKL